MAHGTRSLTITVPEVFVCRCLPTLQAAGLSPEELEYRLERDQLAGSLDESALQDLRGRLSGTSEPRGTSTSSLQTIFRLEADSMTITVLNDGTMGAAGDRGTWNSFDDLSRTLTLQIAALDEQIADLREQPDATEDEIAGRVRLRAEQREQLSYARILSGSASGLLSTLQRAELPLDPVAPRPVLNAALAAVLAITLVLLIGLLRDLLDTRLRSVDQVTSLTNLPLLAAIPVLDGDTRKAPRESANFLRANLGFALANAHPKVIVSTSAGPSEGKSTVALALASSFARHGYRTLLVDLDLRKPQIARTLGITAMSARIDKVLADAEGPLPITTVKLGEHNSLDVIPAVAGVDRPGERIAAAISGLLARAQNDYDVIVFDTAPVMAVADALPMATIASATVLAVSVERSNRRQVANTIDVLRRAGATLAGTVVTHAAAGSRGEGYAYGYGYGYGYGAAYGEKETQPA